MADNDNEKLVSLEEITRDRVPRMTASERMLYHRESAHYFGRMNPAVWSRYARRLAKISKEELATRLGVATEWVTKFELGESEHPPTVAEVLNIIDVCGLWFKPEITNEEPEGRVLMTEKVAGVFVDPNKLKDV